MDVKKFVLGILLLLIGAALGDIYYGVVQMVYGVFGTISNNTFQPQFLTGNLITVLQGVMMIGGVMLMLVAVSDMIGVFKASMKEAAE